MTQNKQLSIRFFSSGYCLAEGRIINPLTGKGKIRFYAVWALIKHPQLGNILFDTGYTPLFFEATRNFPDRLYRWATPAYIDKNETALSILAREGISSEQINYIIVSHFHADHIAGLKDFQKAKFICTRSSYEQMNSVRFMGVVHGILKNLIPNDFNQRVLFIEDISTQKTDIQSGLTFFNLFNDEALKLMYLPGHAHGMVGLLVETNNKKILYASDAAWDVKAFKAGILPNKIVKIFIDSWKDFVETQDKIKLFLKHNPSTELYFTHCPNTLTLIDNHV